MTWSTSWSTSIGRHISWPRPRPRVSHRYCVSLSNTRRAVSKVYIFINLIYYCVSECSDVGAKVSGGHRRNCSLYVIRSVTRNWSYPFDYLSNIRVWPITILLYREDDVNLAISMMPQMMYAHRKLSSHSEKYVSHGMLAAAITSIASYDRI